MFQLVKQGQRVEALCACQKKTPHLITLFSIRANSQVGISYLNGFNKVEEIDLKCPSTDRSVFSCVEIKNKEGKERNNKAGDCTESAWVALINKTYEPTDRGQGFRRQCFTASMGILQPAIDRLSKENRLIHCLLPWNTLLLIIIHQRFPLNPLLQPTLAQEHRDTLLEDFSLPINPLIMHIWSIDTPDLHFLPTLCWASHSLCIFSPHPCKLLFCSFGLFEILGANKHSSTRI